MPPLSDSVTRRDQRSRRHRGRLGWLVAVPLVLLVGAWFWWNSGKPAKSAKPAPPATTGIPRLSAPQAPPAVVSNPIAKAIVELPAKPGVTLVTGTSPAASDSAPPPRVAVPTKLVLPLSSNSFPRPPRDVLEAQIALARRVFSPGSIDGLMGLQTRAALLAFQRLQRLPESGALDVDTRAALALATPPLTSYIVTSSELARLQPVSPTWLGKSQQSALDYETILELVAEQGRASPNLIRRLNPAVDWTNVVPGTEVLIPDVTYPAAAAKAGFAVITLGAKQLQVFDAETNLLAHFPCSIAARVEKRPAGELHIVAIAENPNYTFNPEVFPESAEARELGRKLILPSGPNNPVGVAWVSLDMPGYGIHGTPSPEQVGRTESHGCFRLANWNAMHFLKLAWIGMPVYVEP